MKYLDIEFDVKNLPELDKDFIPLCKFNSAFLAGAKKPVSIALERHNGEIASVDTFIRDGDAFRPSNRYYIERLVKTLLWMKGGYKIYVSGDMDVYEHLKACYCKGGVRGFDWNYMASIYGHEFEIVYVDSVPAAKDSPKRIGGHLDGCRVGFDAGGSDRKASAVIDGEPVYSEEVVWYPKINSDPDYHYNGIVAALKSAASHLPRVDAVGVSSAGVYIDNRTMSASLFLKVGAENFDRKVKDIYIRAIKDTFGDVPFSVVNDGDVTAIAGAMSLNKNNLLGIAMGTSEAVGFVDKNGCVTGWLNELAFVPVDAAPAAMRDEWSGDIGCGVKYFSQDSVAKLAGFAGVEFAADMPNAERLKTIQRLAEEGNAEAAAIYRSIGTYLAHSLALYYDYYRYDNVLLLGRVMSGRGGDIIISTCKSVLADEYPELADIIAIELPNESFRRVGQSVAAASLPQI